MRCNCTEPWRIQTECDAPVGGAAFMYSDGLTDNIGTELVIRAAPAEPGMPLDEHEMAAVLREWAHDLARGEQPGVVVLHAGLKAVRPVGTAAVAAYQWADDHDDIHLDLDDLTDVLEVTWEAASGTTLPHTTLMSAAAVAEEIQALHPDQTSPAHSTQDVAPWQALHRIVVRTAERSSGDLAPLGSLVPLQRERDIGPYSVFGHLRAIAGRDGLTAEFVEATSSATELANTAARHLFGATGAKWHEEHDHRHHGMRIALAVAYGATALAGHVPQDVHRTAVTTLHGVLARPEPRPPNPSLRDTLDRIANTVRSADASSLWLPCQERRLQEQHPGDLVKLRRILTAYRLGIGMLHPPRATDPSLPEWLPDEKAALMGRLLDDVCAAVAVSNLLSWHAWDHIVSPLTSGVDLPDLRQLRPHEHGR